MVTQADATAALGSDPGPGTKQDGVHCTYKATTADDPVGSTITVAVLPINRADFQSLKKSLKNSNSVDVNGIGDDAFAQTSAIGHLDGTIIVLKGSSYVAIMFGSSDTTKPVLDLLTTLAKGAVGRL